MEYKWVALSNTTIGMLMAALDINIVLIALPTIGKELQGMNAFNVLWVMLGYQLVIASVLVNFGRLSDIFGRVRLYTIGFALFTIGSALCGLSSDANQLIVFRIVQASGAAFLFSNSAAILTDAFPLNERGRALGLNQITIVVGSVTGLILGGALTTLIGWRWIFWVNVPIGVFATVWSYFKLKELSARSTDHRLDIGGNISFAAALLLLLLGITLNAVIGLNLVDTVALVALAFLLLVAFVKIESRVSNPMFDLTLFKNRIFNAGNETIFLNSLSRGSFSLVMVFYLQGPLMSMTPLDAGIFLIPMSVAMSIAGPISGSISDRIGFRKPVIIGLFITMIGFIIMSQVGATVTELQLFAPLVLIGAGMGIFASPNRSSIMNAVAAARRGVASGISATLVNVGNTMSIGLAFFIMQISTPKTTLDAIFSGRNSLISNFDPNNFIDSVHLVFTVSTVLLIISIVIYALLGRHQRRTPRVTEVKIS